MKKTLQFKNEIFTWFLLILIYIICLNPNLINIYLFDPIKIPLSSIIVGTLFVIMFVFRNFRKIGVIFVLNNFEIREFIYIFTYYGITFSILLLILELKYLNFIFILIMLLFELSVLISNYYAVYRNSFEKNTLIYVRLKEITFVCLILLLIFENMPFASLNIPMNYIIASAYIIIQGNIVYKQIK